MIQRRKPLVRKSPLVRGARIVRISKARSADRRTYAKDREDYLAEHPWCQIFIARRGLNEAEAIAKNGYSHGKKIPRATQIHHRNKSRGDRLLDKLWWMSACAEEHEWVENNKTEAREIGLLLPIQSDDKGRWGAGNQALTTTALIAVRFRNR
jgi:hypothetical protein